jgi:hypothetical protein
MKFSIFKLFAIFYLAVASISLADEPKPKNEASAEEKPNGIGPEKAITNANKADGFKLSVKALKRLEIKTSKIQSRDSIKVPTSSLVFYQSEVGIYRVRSGWFKLIPIKILNKSSSETTIASSELKNEDEVIVHGSDLLRLADLNLWSSDEGGE